MTDVTVQEIVTVIGFFLFVSSVLLYLALLSMDLAARPTTYCMVETWPLLAPLLQHSSVGCMALRHLQKSQDYQRTITVKR